MKKLFSLSVFLTIILLLVACEKEKPPVDKEFTLDHWPIVKTLGATPLTSSTAKLSGTVNTYGLSTTVTFEYGTTLSQSCSECMVYQFLRKDKSVKSDFLYHKSRLAIGNVQLAMCQCRRSLACQLLFAICQLLILC